MVQMAGLLGEEETIPQRTTEYLCSGESVKHLPARAGGA